MWASFVLRRLLMEAVERVIGSQPSIEGWEKSRLDSYFARASREVALADLSAFEEWLRVLPEARARSMKHGPDFAAAPPGTWPDRLAEELRRGRRTKRASVAQPSAAAEFEATGPAVIAMALSTEPAHELDTATRRRRSTPRAEVHPEDVYAREAAATPSIEEQLAAAKRAAGGSR